MQFKNQQTHLAVVMIVGLLTFGLSSCAKHDSGEVVFQELPSVDVKVETIEARRDTGVFQAVGRVKNMRESTIASKVMGKVAAIRVKAGERVDKGHLLIAIDDRDVRGQMEQAKGALAQAEAARVIAKQMLDRFETLKKSDSASQAKYDKAVFDFQSALGAVAQAKGALKTAQSYLKETRVVAPFKGRIIDTLIEEGEMASPGYPLVRMEGDGELEFEATVTAQEIGALAVGQPVTVELDSGRNDTRELSGTIYEIVPAMDRVTHSNTVRIRLVEMKGLRSGMFGRASFARQSGSCPGVLIPEDRLVRQGQLTGVFVVGADDRLRLRLVREGRHLNGQVEVLSGLANGDRLVASAIEGLVDGQPAKVVQ